MTVPLKLEPAGDLPTVRYNWDADTGILVADLAPVPAIVPAPGAADMTAGMTDGVMPGVMPGVMAMDAGGCLNMSVAAHGTTSASGSLSVEGDDGSWVILDLADGWLRGVQVAVWPYLHRRSLQPPPAPPARARLSLPRSPGRTFAVEVSAPVRAEVDLERRHVRLGFGRRRAGAVFAIASGVLLELDPSQSMSGLWLLGVPPSPTTWTVP